jgi:hypothetical protein
MIKLLRKKHWQIWMAWAVLLPLGILFAWLIIPNQPPVKLLSTETEALLPEVIRTADKKDYLLTVRSNKEKTHWQLEWKSKTVLTVPSAVIYRTINSNTGITKQQLIGRIEARRDYVFVLPDDSSGYKQLQLILYDFIHQRTIDSINFLP